MRVDLSTPAAVPALRTKDFPPLVEPDVRDRWVRSYAMGAYAHQMVHVHAMKALSAAAAVVPAFLVLAFAPLVPSWAPIVWALVNAADAVWHVRKAMRARRGATDWAHAHMSVRNPRGEARWHDAQWFFEAPAGEEENLRYALCVARALNAAHIPVDPTEMAALRARITRKDRLLAHFTRLDISVVEMFREDGRPYARATSLAVERA